MSDQNRGSGYPSGPFGDTRGGEHPDIELVRIPASQPMRNPAHYPSEIAIHGEPPDEERPTDQPNPFPEFE